MTQTAALNIRIMEDGDEPAILELLTASLAGGPQGQRSAETFRWKHRDSPFGRSIGLVAERDGRLVGVRLAMRWRFALDGRTIRAVRMVDTATHPSARGLGIFRALTLAVLDQYADEIDLVFNTPNAASRPGYLKMGWSPVGTVPIAIRAVRPTRLLRGAWAAKSGSANAVAREIDCRHPDVAIGLLDSRLPDLLATLADVKNAGRLHTVRSMDYLRWRYSKDSGLDYRAIPFESAGQLRGLAIGRPRVRGGLQEFTLSEILYAPGDRAACRQLLSRAARSGTDHVATHLGPGRATTVNGWSAGYVSAPGLGMGLVTNPRLPLPVDPMAVSSWALSLGDLEVF